MTHATCCISDYASLSWPSAYIWLCFTIYFHNLQQEGWGQVADAGACVVPVTWCCAGLIAILVCLCFWPLLQGPHDTVLVLKAVLAQAAHAACCWPVNMSRHMPDRSRISAGRLTLRLIDTHGLPPKTWRRMCMLRTRPGSNASIYRYMACNCKLQHLQAVSLDDTNLAVAQGPEGPVGPCFAQPFHVVMMQCAQSGVLFCNIAH